MPIYEYKCDSCETKFEKLIRRAADETELACPSCGERHLSQQYSTFAPHAGSGPSSAAAEAPRCGSGMCGNPGMCGMN
jgi:putative FmdB family regulatory protein